MTKSKIQKISIVVLVFIFFLASSAFCSDGIEEAKELADKGDYKKAYERLVVILEEMHGEIKNLQGLVQYYKDELAKINNPPQIVDFGYNEAANRLWASAWNFQHDGIFKKAGKEKEEYLQRAVDTYKRIVIDYPYSNNAEEAQYRIGRIYYKFIKDYELASAELQRYINMYPKGRFASEAKELLDRVRR